MSDNAGLPKNQVDSKSLMFHVVATLLCGELPDRRDREKS
jgi:hypothetical protein